MADASTDIDAILAGLNLTATEQAQIKAATIQPRDATVTNDPLVYTGTPGKPAVTGKGRPRPGSYQHGPVPDVIKKPATADSTTTSSAAYKQFVNLTPDEKAEIQTQMFIAGYYGKNANAHDILFGQADPDSISAWIQAVNQAAFAYDSGQKLTVAQLLAQQAAGYGAAGIAPNEKGFRTSAAERADAAGSGGSGSGPRISVTAASELAKMAQQLGVSILGRAANQDEQRLVIAAVQRQEAAFTGSGGAGERPAPQAIGEDVLRGAAPVEAEAHGYADSYQQLLKIVGGGG